MKAYEMGNAYGMPGDVRTTFTILSRKPGERTTWEVQALMGR
jgi:hypothetical protein